MKSKNVIWIILVIALVGVGLWWFMRPAAAAPEKTAGAPMHAKADVPVRNKIEVPKPLATPVQIKSETTNSPSTSVDAPPDAADLQADLKTAIPDYARIIRSEGPMTAMFAYQSPDHLAQIDPQVIQQVLATEARDRQIPKVQHTDEVEAQAFEALENQIPTYNAAGDEATYMASPGVPGVNGLFPVIFIKINGKWYLKGGG